MREIGDVLRSRTRQHRLARVSNFAILAVGVSLMLAGSGQLLAQTNGLGSLLQGEPVTGKGTGTAGQTATSQPLFLDATQFPDSDMCASIADACAALGTTVHGLTFPLGATIDARGFIGNQVCAATDITTMLFKCVPQGSSTGATGGKLLLGNVNLYADGPTSGNYTDNVGADPSGIGTPALHLHCLLSLTVSRFSNDANTLLHSKPPNVGWIGKSRPLESDHGSMQNSCS